MDAVTLFFLFVYVATGLGYPRKEKGSSNVPKHIRRALGGPLAYRLVDYFTAFASGQGSEALNLFFS